MCDRAPIYRLLLSSAVAAVLTACASKPPSWYSDSVQQKQSRQSESQTTQSIEVAPVGNQIAGTALSLVGVPYQYGGMTPDGFDCSGLVHYTYDQFGIRVPRTSRDQFHASTPVSLARVSPGDLLFFDIGGRISHVGIYLGDGKFVHAPKTGTQVTVNRISDPFYEKHFERAGRLAN